MTPSTFVDLSWPGEVHPLYTQSRHSYNDRKRPSPSPLLHAAPMRVSLSSELPRHAHHRGHPSQSPPLALPPLRSLVAYDSRAASSSQRLTEVHKRASSISPVLASSHSRADDRPARVLLEGVSWP